MVDTDSEKMIVFFFHMVLHKANHKRNKSSLMVAKLQKEKKYLKTHLVFFNI